MSYMKIVFSPVENVLNILPKLTPPIYLALFLPVCLPLSKVTHNHWTPQVESCQSENRTSINHEGMSFEHSVTSLTCPHKFCHLYTKMYVLSFLCCSLAMPYPIWRTKSGKRETELENTENSPRLKEVVATSPVVMFWKVRQKSNFAKPELGVDMVNYIQGSPVEILTPKH